MSSKIQKLQLTDPVDTKEGVEFLDLIRDGRANELQPVKVASVMQKIVLSVNGLIIENNKLVEEKEKMQSQLDSLEKRLPAVSMNSGYEPTDPTKRVPDVKPKPDLRLQARETAKPLTRKKK